MAEVEEIADHWQGEARLARGETDEDPVEVIDVGPREVSEEKWKQIAEAEEKFADVNFGRRNPLA